MAGIFDKSVAVVITFLLIALITMSALAILIGLAFDTGFSSGFRSDYNESELVVEARYLKTFEEAAEFCESHNQSLPAPNTQEEENDLIGRIVRSDYINQCDNFFFGYKQSVSLRYASLDNVKKWPSLRESREVSIPSEDRDCIDFNVTSLEVLQVVPCKGRTLDCIAVFNHASKGCSETLFSCVSLTHGVNGTITSLFKDIQEKHPGKYDGVLVLDPNHMPVAITNLIGLVDTCTALAVKDLLAYESLDGGKKLYKSRHIVVKDPEYDCVGIKPDESFHIVTAQCDEPSCTVCV